MSNGGTSNVSHIPCWMVLLLLAAWSGSPAYAQPSTDSIRQRALAAFHGPDGQGKDGPLAPVGFDLALLHAQWETHQAHSPAEPFEASGSLPVSNGYVTVDATAAQDVAELRDSLEALGLTGGAQAGVVVSGRLPVASIPEAATLASLRAMRPARAMTHQGTPSSAAPAASRQDTTGARVTADTAARGDRSTTPDAVSPLYWVGGIVVLIVGLLYFLLQRRI